MRIITIFLFIFLISCQSKWEDEPINEFLSEKKIDTTKYNTYDELYKTGKINKIKSINSNENAFIFNLLVSENEFVYIEKRHPSGFDKSIFLKINKNGNIIDSLIIYRGSSIINDYIIHKNSYCTWLIDSNKNFKPIKRLSYFSKSDSIYLEALVKKINKNNLKFYTRSEYGNDSISSILLFKKNELEMHYYSSNSNLSKQLIIKDTVKEGFSSRFKELNSININEFFKYDNFYAYSFVKQTRKGISGGDFFSNTGRSVTFCNSYKGTYFITLQNKLKLKLINQQLCENENTDEYSGEASVYTEKFLNFYLIHNDVYNYYIVKK